MSKEHSNQQQTTENTSVQSSVSRVKPVIQSQLKSVLQPRYLSYMEGNQETESEVTSTSSTQLPEEVQAKMENSFGQDFSAVNIHPDSMQAKNIGAQAYAQGTDIHFAPGKYDPSSQQGQELLGHELTHVVQQKSGRVKPTVQGKGMEINNDPALEKEADEMGKLASEGEKVNVLGNGFGIQKKDEDLKATTSGEFMRKMFSGISASVGTDGSNVTTDVSKLASALKVLKYEVSEESITTGTSDEKLVECIKSFQKTKKYSQTGRIDPGSSAAFDLFPYESDLDKVYGGRDGKWGKFLKDQKLTGTVGADGKKPSLNNAEDVKKVAGFLNSISTETFKLDISTEALGSKCDKGLIDAIKKYQTDKCGINPADGIISPAGGTAKKMGFYTEYSLAGRIQRTYGKSDITYSNSGLMEDTDYYKRQDFIEKSMGVEADSDERKALDIARKAAQDSTFYDEYTKSVTNKFVIESGHKAENGKKLSALLEGRVKKLHKFLVASGMYAGDMLVTSGIRSPEVAHLWSTEHAVLYESGIQNTIEQNLITMHNEDPTAEIIKDKDENEWSKKEHFTFDEKDKTKTKATGIDFAKVKEYVLTFDRGRVSKKSAAAEGYDAGTKERLPNTGLHKSLHLTGDAIDVNSYPMVDKEDAMIDLIALNFGLIRAAANETWHFECTDKRISSSEQQVIDTEKR